MAIKPCVGTYLATRLIQLGIKHLFAVPGDYTSDLLEIIDQQNGIERIGCCNELNAGYAADGYARANGLGAVTTTTGVGAFSLLNAIGGAYVEKIPVITIIGTLSNTKLLDEINAGELFHHNVNTSDFVKDVYKNVTVAFERITNPLMAPAQIDRVITACISQSRPAAIEIMEDCYYMPCPEPQGLLAPVPLYEPFSVLLEMSASNVYAKQIVTAVFGPPAPAPVSGAVPDIYNLLKASKKPVFWIGKEISVYGLEEKFLKLLSLVKAPFTSSLLGKSAIAENNPWYIGVYNGVFTTDYTQNIMKGCDCIIGLGVWNTDLNNFGKPTLSAGNPATVFASRDVVKVGEELYVQVSLEILLDNLIDVIEAKGYTPVWNQTNPPPLPPMPPPAAALTYDNFFATLNNNLTTNNLVVAEIGLSTFGGSSFLRINRQNGFLGQTIWASIGWSVPAGLGASFTPNTRAIVVVGDGAFKLTCQEISTMVKEKRNTVIFVLNNNVYAVEQILLNPAPFEKNSTVPFEAANILQRWDYISLMKGFSNNDATAKSANVNTVQDLQNVFVSIKANPNSTFLVNINLNERDYPAAWGPFVPKN